MTYCAYITTIKEIRPHSNADRLNVVTVFGNDVIVTKDYQLGDKILYLPTDGQLDYDFAMANRLLRVRDEEGNETGYMDAEKRNIKTIKLRGETSDGIVLKADCLAPYTDVSKLTDGDTISEIGGVVICQKYIPRGKVSKEGTPKSGKPTVKEKDLYPHFKEHLDTAQLAYNTRKFKEGDICYITLKLHGTSQRMSVSPKIQKPKWWQKLLGIKPKMVWTPVTGTRRVVLKSDEEIHSGYYGDNTFRMKYHDLLSSKLPKGITVYFEVVGYTDNGTLIMPEVRNNKFGDKKYEKEFIKQYGETTKFTYGCGMGESDIYVYRMTMTNEDGHEVEIPWEVVKIYCDKWGVKYTPELDKFIFTTEEDLMERVNTHIDGADPIGKSHIREGVIVRIEGKEQFTAYKAKSTDFKILEGIIKEQGVLDMEEEASLGEFEDSEIVE